MKLFGYEITIRKIPTASEVQTNKAIAINVAHARYYQALANNEPDRALAIAGWIEEQIQP